MKTIILLLSITSICASLSIAICDIALNGDIYKKKLSNMLFRSKK